jgi:hypothetical protein
MKAGNHDVNGKKRGSIADPLADNSRQKRAPVYHFSAKGDSKKAGKQLVEIFHRILSFLLGNDAQF